MKSAMQKDFWREIGHTKSRFFSIMILVALSVAFLSGLKATAPDMKHTGDDYLDSLHLADIQVLSTLGLTDEDIDAIRAQKNIENAEGEYVLDAFASSDGAEAVVKVLSLSNQGINDVLLREKEGLLQNKGWFALPGKETPASPITEICENGVFYRVDVENGQKTGFFLDQKFNRLAVARLARGKRVLDCFTHTGSFALNAAKGGAEHVTAVDVSESAVEMARANAARNGLTDRMDFLAADVFDLLPQLEAAHEKPYDFIILDPPAFTKSRRTANNAEKGYKEINLRAMRLLPRGGYLATASCSHFMPAERFERMLRSAAADAGVELRQIEARTQASDHPILWNVPETDYLKFYLFQVV